MRARARRDIALTAHALLCATAMQASVHAVAFSEANGLIASGSKDRTVRLWLPTACVPAAAGACGSASRLHMR